MQNTRDGFDGEHADAALCDTAAKYHKYVLYIIRLYY